MFYVVGGIIQKVVKKKRETKKKQEKVFLKLAYAAFYYVFKIPPRMYHLFLVINMSWSSRSQQCNPKIIC